MATPAWVILVRQRIVDVEGRCSHALDLLGEVHTSLAQPMSAADAGPVRARIVHAQERLDAANHDLNIAVCLMLAAEHLALHGGSPNPAEPLTSIEHLGGQDAASRSALTKLQVARSHAANAYEAVEWCRGHLSTACLLLDHPGLTNVDRFIDNERVVASDALGTAIRIMQVCASQSVGAHLDVTGLY